jgi:hypothetical protein
VALLQPRDIMKRRVDSALDAPMVAVDRFVSADLCILEAVEKIVMKGTLK